MEEKTFFDEKWKALEKIGEGSFGTVYKAEKSQYGVKSYSAIKQILVPQTEKDYSRLKSEGMTQSDIEKSYDNQVKKWVEEIEFLNQFKDNVNIVSIEDFEVLPRKDIPGRIINIRMELLQNIDDHVLNGTTTDKTVLKMALNILNALEDCEEKNVVHRDIKPDNVFINSRGIYKIGDFGEAKSIEKTVSNMSKKGTENYMAPEIYKGERGSRSVDTYSLGIMLYKYFNNNRLPFIPDYPKQITFEDREEALYKRMSGEKMKAPIKASDGVAKIILKACSYNVEDRYKSAMEFRNDVEKEYKKIIEQTKLFDFQESKIEEKSNEISYDKTEGIFDEKIEEDHSDISYNKTVGVFQEDKIENNDTKIEEIDEEKNIKEQSTVEKSNESFENKLIMEESKINTVYDKTTGIFDNETVDEKEFVMASSEKSQFGFEQATQKEVKMEERNIINNSQDKKVSDNESKISQQNTKYIDTKESKEKEETLEQKRLRVEKENRELLNKIEREKEEALYAKNPVLFNKYQRCKKCETAYTKILTTSGTFLIIGMFLIPIFIMIGAPIIIVFGLVIAYMISIVAFLIFNILKVTNEKQYKKLEKQIDSQVKIK